MKVIKHENIGGTIFPITYCDNGMVLVDYPMYDPIVAKKVTEEGRKNIETLSKMLTKFRKDNNIKIILNDKEY